MRNFKVQYNIKVSKKKFNDPFSDDVELVKKYLVVKAATLQDAKSYVKNKYPNATSIKVTGIV